MIVGNKRNNRFQTKKSRSARRFVVHRKKKNKAPMFDPRTKSRRMPSPNVLLILLIVVAVAGAFVYHLHIRFEGVRLGYETSQARSERSRLLVERRELRLELASLKSPQRIESEAREKLGMEMPDYRQIISIGKKQRRMLASGGAR